MTQRQPSYTALLAAAVIGFSAVPLGGGLSTAHAQDSVQIQFKPGATSTTINGTIVGNEYIDYVVRAKAGQTMVVSLAVTGTNGNGSASFNILPAWQDFPALYNGSTAGDKRAEVTLPSSGDWAIRIYLMGNDADTGKTVGYSIDVYIAPGQGSEGAGSSGSASGLLPEEDFFFVRLSGGGVLNVRDAPRAGAQKIGELRDGRVVRNAGGCTMSDGQQWCKVQASDGGVIGWVAARFLRLPGPSDQGGLMEGASGQMAPDPAGPPFIETMDGSVSDAAVNACRSALDAQTDGAVRVVGSEFSQAATAVYLRVGANGAPWRCLVSGDGSNPSLMFMGSEGAL